ncbi:hypothetical protein CK203_114267 [Vitis vinifera]|uniref:Uncharacterized protein n=1 Tax=Vitis vinifera TaxID=29760 RepID=A0A438CBC8_VITVI|nr:hypothetical protein CK203_114267 [Vitis vinifera]
MPKAWEADKKKHDAFDPILIIDLLDVWGINFMDLFLYPLATPTPWRTFSLDLGYPKPLSVMGGNQEHADEGGECKEERLVSMLHDSLWAYITAYKTILGMLPYRLVMAKLVIEQSRSSTWT